jgi:hypothetical protein
VEFLRPSRLNYAGWCVYCGERECAKASCIKGHAESIWGPCSVCGGSQLLDLETDKLCGVCIGGLTEYDSFEEVERVIEAERAARHLTVVGLTKPTELYVTANRPSRGVTVSDPDYRPAPGMEHVRGWGL